MRAIDADRLLTDRMKEHYYHLPNGDIAIPIIDIEHAPTIIPERKRGRWQTAKEDERNQIVWVECSECGQSLSWEPNYCPNCGAAMQEDEA